MRTRTRIAPSPATPLFGETTRPHRIVAELDARGGVDRHTTMCLKNAIEDALASGARHVMVDLRDLVVIDSAGLVLLRWARAACHGCDAELGLLVSAGARHHAIAAACTRSGLGAQLRFA
ncbi:MAG: hypothetical protein QOG15_3099 [Solirubrobacteraceae bacterium]|nr:hypothetical protein [Solirubrobacteraceae bacterium]